jgi:hypothetical protein
LTIQQTTDTAIKKYKEGIVKLKLTVFLLLSVLSAYIPAWAGLTKTEVSQLYVSIFGRASEGQGNTYWQTFEDMTSAADAMLDTQAARDYFGTSLNSDQAFIDHIYLNTLNKDYWDDPTGITYWINELNSGKTRGEVVTQLVRVIGNYAPGRPHYDPDDAATVTAYHQFTNRVAVSDYMADAIWPPPSDWKTVTHFGLGALHVTEEAASVYAAQQIIDTFSDVSAADIFIADYTPRNGPAGSPVFLQLQDPVLETDELEGFFNDQEIAVTGISENVVQVMIPNDVASGYIAVKAGNSVSNAVYFDTEQMIVTPLMTADVNPSSQEQSISHNGEITVTLPPDLLDQERTLTLSQVTGAPANSINPFAANIVFDVSLEGMEQLADYIEITVKYDPMALHPDYPAADQLTAMRWDEAEQFWLPLPYQVNSESQTLSFYTDHLSLLGIGILVTGSAAVSIPVTWVGEKLLNDVYVTPGLFEGNFRILYSKSSILEHPNLNDTAWSKTTYKNHIFPLAAYRLEHPRFIQDIGNLLETALSNYVDVHGFQDPILEPGSLWGISVNPITVKVDSWWVWLAGDPNYEKLFENIHLPTLYLNDFDPPEYFAYGTMAHELFHRIQAEYYGVSGFLYPSWKWWIEAAAEYAAYRIAWPGKQLDGHLNGMEADFFSYPINHTGVPSGWDDRAYEYAASVFIQFLVEKKGLDFREMVEYVAQGDPLSRLDEFVLSKHSVSLKDYYAEFAAWAIFSQNGFMEKLGFSAADIAGPNGKDSFSIPENQTLTISVAAESDDMVVNVYITEENKRFSGDVTPSLQGTLKNGDSLDMPVRNLGQSNLLYLLAVTGKAQDTLEPDFIGDTVRYIPQKELTVTVSNQDKNPVEKIQRSFTLEGSYLAKLWPVELDILPQELPPGNSFSFTGKRRDGIARNGTMTFYNDGTHEFNVQDADGQVNAGGSGTWSQYGSSMTILFSGVMSPWYGQVTEESPDGFVLADTGHGTYTFTRQQ